MPEAAPVTIATLSCKRIGSSLDIVAMMTPTPS